AHSLLGDICSEEGLLEDAQTHYSQAMHYGNVPSDQRKLDSISQRITDRNAAAVISSLGLPTTKPRAKVWAISSATFVAAIGIAGYFIGQSSLAKGRSPVVTVPIVIDPPKEAPPVTVDPEPVRTAPEPIVQTKTVLVSTATAEDNAITGELKSKSAEPDSIVDARKDMRTGQITVTLSSTEGQDYKILASKFAITVLDGAADCPQVTVRVEKAKKLIYEADVLRADLVTSRDGGGQPDPLQLLRNEWSAVTQ
ncbi:MAG: hypothetical protein K8R88_12625, partial [Armatimonadetes bacterium]|nr:hypothetical protein [Armatimonadota bacterium]